MRVCASLAGKKENLLSLFTELQRRVTALTTELEVAREEKASVAAKRLDLERTVRVSGTGQLPFFFLPLHCRCYVILSDLTLWQLVLCLCNFSSDAGMGDSDLSLHGGQHSLIFMCICGKKH